MDTIFSTQKPYSRRKQIWSPNESYTNHRIPGMLVTNRGTLLIYCEARREANDWAQMDILMQRSTDHGITFVEPIVLAEGTEQHPTVNNPVMLQDLKGRIHFLYCEIVFMSGVSVRSFFSFASNRLI